MGPNSSSYSSLDLVMNQSSHSRPILPTYNQALGVGLGLQSDLRLPVYKQCYLARYTPYCRYTSHPRFFCNDVCILYFDCFLPISLTSQNVPCYDDALVKHHLLYTHHLISLQTTTSPPSRRAQNLQNAPPQPQPIDPGKAERDKSALNDFFVCSIRLFQCLICFLELAFYIVCSSRRARR